VLILFLKEADLFADRRYFKKINLGVIPFRCYCKRSAGQCLDVTMLLWELGMTQNTPVGPHWFVTDENRAKAQIKYELNHLESRLTKYLVAHPDQEQCPDEVISLSERLASLYLDYLKLLSGNKIPGFDPATVDCSLIWSERIYKIEALKLHLTKITDEQEKLVTLSKIASLYQQFNSHNTQFTETSSKVVIPPQRPVCELQVLFQKDNLKLWLNSLVNFWNHYEIHRLDLSILFREWELKQQQVALNFFSNPDLVNLVNTIFFYKLYPDKLFNVLIHPEKLVSVRMRLGVIHHFIEKLQQQLYSSAKQHGLKTGVDYLFHGDELPQGIMIEDYGDFRQTIQAAVKQVKIHFTPENEQQIMLDRLHDLGLAYKFWFNPNRLIDAVMVLQQRLVKVKSTEASNLLVFHEAMVVLYSQLTTTECLNLYGYFANNDSRYLLYTLFTILQGNSIDWLGDLRTEELGAIKAVFNALQTVMEALRIALKSRHVSTEPYIYDLAKEYIKAGRRNREAVFRIIAIYSRDSLATNERVEQLFSFVEESN